MLEHGQLGVEATDQRERLLALRAKDLVRVELQGGYVLDVPHLILAVGDGIHHGGGRLAQAKGSEQPVAGMNQLGRLCIAAQLRLVFLSPIHLRTLLPHIAAG